jgi:hypothetical protein
MTCRRCGKAFAVEKDRCPHCGSRAAGVFQTSTVLISVDGEDSVYRTIEETPAKLRERLVRSIHGSNSATIVIADRRGRRELLRTLRRPSGATPRRRLRLPPKPAMLVAIILLALAVLGLLLRL